MEADLHQIIRSGQELSTDHIAYFVYQILGAIKYIHGCNVIHRDLKSANILVNSTCEIRICDFGGSLLLIYSRSLPSRVPGLARGYEKYLEDNSEKVTPLTEYVATRWYRAPEIMLGFDGYDQAIDIWSIGCIFGELLNGKPIFQGKDYVDQLKCIFEYLGSPSEEIIARIAQSLETVEQFRDAIWDEIQDYRAQVRSFTLEHSHSPVTSLHSHVPILKEPIPEEAEPEEPQTKDETQLEHREPKFTIGPAETISQPETSPQPLPQIQQEAGPTAIPRPRKNSQHQDPFATFSRRSSAIFGGMHSPAPPNSAITPSRGSSFTYFPVLDEGDSATPSATIPVRSRIPSMIDGSQYRHLRTLSTVSIYENATRPGGLAAVAPIGKFVGAERTTGADGPPSTPPVELRQD
ncbi:Mitogen-activated protein kinase [Serendipita sp. 397]|nr:Mitogen-activated protein kinase [Serendipita sp. 397]